MICFFFTDDEDDERDFEDDPPKQKATTTTTTTTKSTTTLPPSPTQSTPVQQQQTEQQLVDPISNSLPPVLRPPNGVTSWCSPSFILSGVELNGGIKSGPSKSLGNVTNIQECVQKCCTVPDCTVAYTEDSVCYAIRCLNKNICQSKMSTTPSKSVGYVVRNGWSLFASEQLALRGAAFFATEKPEPIPETTLTTSTATINTTIATTSTRPNTTTSTPPITTIPPNISVDISAITPPDSRNQNQKNMLNQTECRSNGTMSDHRFVAGMKAGIFTDHGEAADTDDIEACVKYCCMDKLCDVAYMVGRRCYTLQCFSPQTCRTFAAPNFFLNPTMAFIVRDIAVKSVDVVSLEYIKHNYTVPLLNSTMTNSSMKGQLDAAGNSTKKTMESSVGQLIKIDGLIDDDDQTSGSGSGIDSPGFARDKVPSSADADILNRFEKTQEKHLPKERYYFPLREVDIDTIQSLSKDQGKLLKTIKIVLIREFE